ncbi:hypothetical protein CLV91_0876 [Maribacter vaceletii]|uniref:Uncharacterized protein n=1 Tax=Maribacter vaceletii TaxID=1206816 RepID=A0A495EFV8_9FLAO|nr:hypothetical protein [Maribacter vaceletii]RKR14797.1 hypothetical protein CLV91_0876 [Maribacter vaceletii]
MLIISVIFILVGVISIGHTIYNPLDEKYEFNNFENKQAIIYGILMIIFGVYFIIFS